MSSCHKKKDNPPLKVSKSTALVPPSLTCKDLPTEDESSPFPKLSRGNDSLEIVQEEKEAVDDDKSPTKSLEGGEDSPTKSVENKNSNSPTNSVAIKVMTVLSWWMEVMTPLLTPRKVATTAVNLWSVMTTMIFLIRIVFGGGIRYCRWFGGAREKT